jgi:hypothetical protein
MAVDTGLHGRTHPLSHSFSHATHKKDAHKRSASAGRVGTLATEDTELLDGMKSSAMMPEFPDRLKHNIDRFHEHVEHMQEVITQILFFSLSIQGFKPRHRRTTYYL